MKKRTILFIIVAALLFSCSNPNPSAESKAQKLIKDFVLADLNNPKGYEPESFGSLDSLFSKLEDDYDYNLNFDKFDKFLGLLEDLENEIKRKESYPSLFRDYKDEGGEYEIDLEYLEMYGDSMEYYLNIAENIKANFKPKFLGWEMVHRYFVKTGFGGGIEFETKFYFDEDITKIVKTEIED